MFNRKIFTIIASGAFLALGVISSANAATDSLATAKANIITGLTIIETQTLNFGIIAPDSVAVVQTVTMVPGGAISAVGGASLFGSDTDGVFNVSGEPTYAYSINGPVSVTITEPVTLDTMTVGTFRFTSSNNGHCNNTDAATCNAAPFLVLPAGGTDTLTVGGTLTLDSAPNQSTGAYSGAFPLEVIYN